MSRPLLSVAMIMRNETRNIPRCLSALQLASPLVGEVCIYDTGSTDGSIEMAESFGATVSSGHWNGDFSEARNAALDMTRGRWILVLDLDEELIVDQPKLRRTLRHLQGSNLRFSLEIHNMMNEVRSSSVHIGPRIISKNHYRYVGAVHEQPEPVRGTSQAPAAIPFDQASIRHWGYSDPELVAQKLRRNRSSAELTVRQLESVGAPPRQLLKARLDRATAYANTGRVNDALVDYEYVRKGTQQNLTPYIAGGLERYADLLIDLDKTDAALELLEELGDTHAASFRKFLRARIAYTKSEYSAAHSLLKKIDTLQYSHGVAITPLTVLSLRFKSAMRCEAFEDALVTALTLIVHHDAVLEVGAYLAPLWNNDDYTGLAELLCDAPPQTVHSLALYLSKLPGNAQILSRELQRALDDQKLTS